MKDNELKILHARPATHEELKDMAVEFLKKEHSFNADEIYLEKHVPGFVVDVLGKKPSGYTVAVECGGVDYTKVMRLKTLVNEVYVLPKLKILEKKEKHRRETLETIVEVLEEKIKYSRKMFKPLLEYFEALEESLGKAQKSLKNTKGELESQRQSLRNMEKTLERYGYHE